MTGNNHLQREGKVKGLADDATDGVEDGIDKVKDKVHHD